MSKLLVIAAALAVSTNALATQETFTTAGPLNCTAISYCVQNTADNLFTLKFIPTYPTSAPSATGFNVNQPAIEISSANGAPLDLNIMQVTMTGSNAYNGMSFIGAIQLETQDFAGNWAYQSQWSTSISATKGIYVMFNGRNLSSPYIKSVKAIRLTGVNGATAFRIGMLNMTAH